jgi:CheY-like chemotaxis protein
MTRRGFCPYCRSVQPLGEYHEDNSAAVWCETCRNPIEDAHVARPAAPHRPPTILCVDDDRIVLSFCSDALERQGYRALIASDGPTGIEMAARDRPDLILLDFMMPGMTGLEVCRRLRAQPGLAETPIIVLTASDDPDVGVKAREAGATSTLRKPYGPANIISAIEQALGRRIAPGKP